MSEKIDVESSSLLLDTSRDVETDIWALGITEKSISAEVVGNPYNPGDLDRVGPGKDAQPNDIPKEQFDFIHIRYKSTGVTDSPRMFRLAYEQTKPGGWIEVVENPPSSYTTCSPLDDGTQWKGGAVPTSWAVKDFTTSKMAFWIKQQLIEAGFVEVEEKVWRAPTGPWQKIVGIGRLIYSLLSLSWSNSRVSEMVNPGETYSVSRGPTVFVIARKP
jgi:hypothetical protein